MNKRILKEEKFFTFYIQNEVYKSIYSESLIYRRKDNSPVGNLLKLFVKKHDEKGNLLEKEKWIYEKESDFYVIKEGVIIGLEQNKKRN